MSDQTNLAKPKGIVSTLSRMTMESEPEYKSRFVVRMLPWVVATGALALYTFTINPWVSLANLSQVARISGWTWQPELFSPAYFAATYPLHWLPAKWMPLGLNLFSALCAALTLAQLTRSVALLPHDRTHEEREREKSDYSLLTIRSAWVPPVVAALMCGLQLTFWENATNGTTQMFDLLLFAWIIRALLEYRLNGRDSWLYRAALVYALGMTGNFAMWGFLPVFIAALMWLRGVSFLNPRFLVRIILCGLVGLSLYLLLPSLATMWKSEPVNFWQALKVNLVFQKNIILLYPKLPTQNLENMNWTVLVAVCVLPVLLFSVRWPSHLGDTSQLGTRLATIVFHVMFGLYLCVCVWNSFDAPFSPRHNGLEIPFLTFYYLAALSIGFFTGYFLLVFRNVPVRGRPLGGLVRMVNRAVLTLIGLLAIFAPTGLILKNLPQIRTTNGPILRDYATAVAENLPQSGILLSDDPRRLLVTKAWLAQTGRVKDYILLDTQALIWPAYHRFLSEQYPGKWELTASAKRQTQFTPPELLQLITRLANKSELWYLHPSFGYYFESFYLVPHGLVYQLKPYRADSPLVPPRPPELIAENEAFWTKAASDYLREILAVTMPVLADPTSVFVERCLKAIHVPLEENEQAKIIGAYYSRALNQWGVEMQMSGNLEKAGEHFALARQLNQDNIVAQINQEYNKNLQAGRNTPIELSKSVEDRFGKYRNWDEVLGQNGPYDEPTFCYSQGYTFLSDGLYRQAAQSFDRVRALSPTDAASRMWLAQLYLNAQQPSKTLELSKEILDHPERFILSPTNRNELFGLEARAHFARREPEAAVQILEAALAQSPNDEYLLGTATSIFSQSGQYSNALATLNRHLKIAPDNPTLLLNKGALCMQMEEFKQAIPPLTRVLEIESNNCPAQLNRAIAYLRSDQLEAAQRDYEMLQRLLPRAYQVYYGLGEIAYRRKDTNAAIRYYEAYLTNTVSGITNAAPNQKEAVFVTHRLAELKGVAH